MNLLGIFKFIYTHPLNKKNKLKALQRVIRWQIGSRLLPGAVAVDFVAKSRLLVKTGMTGATGNIYTGLHEFEDMSFLLHFLRKDDIFVDIGANVGSYTILAGSIAGAKCFSIEPIPKTFMALIDNVNLNGIYEKVCCLNIGIGGENGQLKFTSTLDSMNHVKSTIDTETNFINVPVKKLDDVLGDEEPILMKIDVEGFETEVIAGAVKTLSRHSLIAIIMELNGSGERYGYDETVLHQQMLDYGFCPYLYSPFERQLQPLNTKNNHSGNTLYLRNIERVRERLQNAVKFVINEIEI